MCSVYATFGLVQATRAGGVLAAGGCRVRRGFVDFVVEGRPLLFRLSGLDAVSPLASDVPPAIFTAQVSGLLLEAGAPLDGGRHIIYGCPECESVECGAVTALIERDGDDYVWRDFAWQTGERPDLERNGYHGVGPFRFYGPEYRGALNSLLEGDADSRRRVLPAGARGAPPAKPAAVPRFVGIGAGTAGDVPEAERAAASSAGPAVPGPATRL